MALATAGASGGTPGSPMPSGSSVLGTMCTSMSGAWFMRGFVVTVKAGGANQRPTQSSLDAVDIRERSALRSEQECRVAKPSAVSRELVVFLSSTYADLQPHRAKVEEALARIQTGF